MEVPAPPAPDRPAVSSPGPTGLQLPEPPAPGLEFPLEPLAGAAVKPMGDGRLTVHSENEDIRQVLALLSRDSGVNILIAPTVTGTIRIDLANVTFDQALEAIVRLGNLGVKKVNGLVYVYSAQEAAELEARERKPLVRVYHLNYIRAVDILNMLLPFLSKTGSISTTPSAAQGLVGGAAGLGGGRGAASPAGGTGGGGSPNTPSAALGMGGAGAVSGGGAAVGASATGGNSLAYHDVIVARDFPENLAVIDEIVRRLDLQPPQLLIEAVILSVKLDDQQSLGVNYSVLDNLQRLAFVSGAGAAVNAVGGFSPERVLTTTTNAAPLIGNRPAQLQPGFTDPNSGMKFGFVSKNVSGFIEAIETFSKVNVLASPRVLVLNKQRAEIQLGQRLGFRNTVTNLVASLQTVEFLSVGTLLTLRPFISNDGMIRLEIHPEKSTGALDSSGIPQTNTSEITTNILVPDGATIVIGGLIDDQDSIVEEGIPGLDRLPLVGAAFRTRHTETQKTELIILLTPRILRMGGLPEPRAGLPPKGEMGVPNSGSMPGIPFDKLPADLPLLPTERLLQFPASETFLAPSATAPLPPLPETSSPFPEPMPVTPPETPPPPPPLFEPPVGPNLSRGATPATLPPALGARPPSRDRATQPATLRERPPGEPPQGSHPSEAVYHTLRPGETFSTLADAYYGSAELAEALWIMNRTRFPEPATMQAGMTVAIPPEAAVRDTWMRMRASTPAKKAPSAAEKAQPRGLPRLFRRETIDTWPVPAGTPPSEALKAKRPSDPAPKRSRLFGPKTTDRGSGSARPGAVEHDPHPALGDRWSNPGQAAMLARDPMNNLGNDR
jgi:type II secretory pathway component GspD/PulD (secretin)